MFISHLHNLYIFFRFRLTFSNKTPVKGMKGRARYPIDRLFKSMCAGYQKFEIFAHLDGYPLVCRAWIINTDFSPDPCLN